MPSHAKIKREMAICANDCVRLGMGAAIQLAEVVTDLVETQQNSTDAELINSYFHVLIDILRDESAKFALKERG